MRAVCPKDLLFHFPFVGVDDDVKHVIHKLDKCLVLQDLGYFFERELLLSTHDNEVLDRLKGEVELVFTPVVILPTGEPSSATEVLAQELSNNGSVVDLTFLEVLELRPVHFL